VSGDSSRVRSCGDGVSAALRAFERAREWADLMKALDKVEQV